MRAWAIVAAAGEGSRLGGAGPKAFQLLAGIPMVAHSLPSLAAAGVERIVIVVPDAERSTAGRLLEAVTPSVPVSFVAGGVSRQASVWAGLSTVPADVDRVIVHDAARPLATTATFEATLGALDRAAGAIVAVPAEDTMKLAGLAGDIEKTIPRLGLFRAQTPQAFRTHVLRRAHERAIADGFEGTDDAVLVERLGEIVVIVPGDRRNLKVTTPEDLALAEMLLTSAAEERRA
jgi:2-C-methyl-D-erythritol 4-phosphate cytidylyltransferase